MLNVLEHIKNDEDFLKKAFEILPQGGYLIIAVPANQKAFRFADINAGHIRRYEKKELQSKLENNGFIIEKWMSVGFPLNRTYTWLFNFLNKNKINKSTEEQTAFSGIRNKEGYYGGLFDFVAKILFPILCVLIKIDGFFINSNLGNNFIVFTKKQLLKNN